MSCAATKLDLGAQSNRVDGSASASVYHDGKVIVEKGWGQQAWAQYPS
jgi:CubicO group peptidase (beta-lactamase class C family)